MEEYQAVFRRMEVKYLLNTEALSALMPILLAHMEPDAFPHSSISNLYYDTPDFRMVRRSLEKPQYKEKLRLRSYGVPEDSSTVFPEIKKKAQGVVYKRRVSMPYLQALDSLSGAGFPENHQISRELNWMLGAYPNLAPRVYLSYERDSWRGIQEPDLRLTLDRDILYRTHGLDLRQGVWGEPLLMPGQTLMELKIPGAVPLWLSKALSELRIFPVSYSKYGAVYKKLCLEWQKYETETEFRRYA